MSTGHAGTFRSAEFWRRVLLSLEWVLPDIDRTVWCSENGLVIPSIPGLPGAEGVRAAELQKAALAPITAASEARPARRDTRFSRCRPPCIFWCACSCRNECSRRPCLAPAGVVTPLRALVLGGERSFSA